MYFIKSTILSFIIAYNYLISILVEEKKEI